jgi:anti-sigma regulatory factor (Ser/Thr protein kinase)
MVTSTALTDRLELAATATAPGTARRHARSVLAKWGVRSEDAETVELVVSELVTNAAQHAGSPDSSRSNLGQPMVKRLSLALSRTPVGVLVSVSDHNPLPPMRQNPCVWDEHGRGLLIVETVASAVTVDQVHDHGQVVGKVVSALITTSSQ